VTSRRTNGSGWGGRREGAGRPANLDYFEALAIGAKADRLAERWATRRAHRNIRQRLKATEYFELVADANAVPIKERQEWLHSYAAEYHSDDIDGAIAYLGELESRTASRLLSEPVTQVYGSRRRVIRVVMRWAAWRYKTDVTESRVDRCWKHYRKVFRRELD